MTDAKAKIDKPLFVALVPEEIDKVATELGLAFPDMAVVIRACLDAPWKSALPDWRTATIDDFTVTGYATAWRLSYAGLDAATRRLEKAGAFRHRRIRGHPGELEILVYGRIVRPSQRQIRGSGGGATTSDSRLATSDSKERNRESSDTNRESRGATCGDGTYLVPVVPPPPPPATANASLADHAVLLLAKEVVADEKKKGITVKGIPIGSVQSVAKFRIRDGQFDQDRDAIRRHIARHPDITDAAALLAHWRTNRNANPVCSDPDCVRGWVDTPNGAVKCEVCP